MQVCIISGIIKKRATLENKYGRLGCWFWLAIPSKLDVEEGGGNPTLIQCVSVTKSINDRLIKYGYPGCCVLLKGEIEHYVDTVNDVRVIKNHFLINEFEMFSRKEKMGDFDTIMFAKVFGFENIIKEEEVKNGEEK